MRAVEMIVTQRDLRLARSLLHAVPWSARVAGVLSLLFGIGAALNGGCSLSTLTRPADGG